MKMIVLVHGTKTNLDKMIALTRNKRYNITYIDTEYCSEEVEYEELMGEVEDFSLNGLTDVLFIRFSGRDCIARTIGDEFSEMVIVMSYDKCSKYYTECPVSTFSDLINSFKKETIELEIRKKMFV